MILIYANCWHVSANRLGSYIEMLLRKYMTKMQNKLIWNTPLSMWVFLAIISFLFSPKSTLGDIKSHQELFKYELTKDKQPTFWQIADRLNKTAQITADFRQKKTITVLRNPLLSSGLMVFSAEKGLCWETTAPFYSMLVINSAGITQKDKDGTSKTVIPDQSRAATKLSEVFLAVFLGEKKILEDNFVLYFLGNINDWRIGLRPRDHAVQHFLQSIALKGDDSVTELEILEETGDFTNIQLIPQELVDDVLTLQKQKCFN